MDYKVTYLRDGKVQYWRTFKSYAGWHVHRWMKLLSLYLDVERIRPQAGNSQDEQSHKGNANAGYNPA